MARERESRGFRLPVGVKDQQRLEALELKVKELERRIAKLENGEDESPERDALIEEALALKVPGANGKPIAKSVLVRWKPERLIDAINEAKKNEG